MDPYMMRDKEADDQFTTVPVGPGLERAFGETGASDVRIIRGGGLDSTHPDAERMRHDLAAYHRRRGRDFRFRMRCLPQRAKHGARAVLPHDRFAIVDTELWQWGANVGATHNQVNAYSRGWCAVRTRAVSFYKELWSAGEVVFA